MKKNLKWYLLIAVSAVSLIFVSIYFFTRNDGMLGGGNMTTDTPLINDNQSIGNKLPIPDFLENTSLESGKAEFILEVQYGKTEFKKGYKADTLGYNGNYLGPIIKINKGDEVTINVNNELDDPTTVHWHGLEVIGEMDGGPHQVIMPNTVWQPYFTVDQPAAMLWYHPHLMGKTGEQVYKGLAGLIYIEDENSKMLDIPKKHGINDIPLIVQDKRFTSKGDIPYNLNMMDIMNGFYGDTVIINGTINPELDVKNEVIRLRLLNGSNARTYNFNFDNNETFFQIASDGGFLRESVEMNNMFLSPGERVEILVDLSQYKSGDKLFLRDTDSNLMAINVVEETVKVTAIPKNLVDIIDYNEDEVVRTREFVMSGMGPMVNINGKQMDMNVIDEEVNLGELEKWIVSNDASGMGMGMMNNSTPHPFHVHAVQFQIVERNGKVAPLNERGWKDTVLVDNNEEVVLLVKFSKKGLFMYHCHILEHEDSGMMGQFLVK